MRHRIQIHMVSELPHYVGPVLMQNEEAEWSELLKIFLAGANSQIGFEV